MKQVFTSIILLLLTTTVWAQAPKVINYQGVARNASGVAYAGQQISVRLSIHTGTPEGTIEYSETRNVTTNQFGLFNVGIGSAGASFMQGSINGVNWNAGNKFLKTEISINGQPYASLGTTQMMSVPFAMHSKEAKEIVLPFAQTGSSSTDLLSVANSDNTTTTSSTIKATAASGRAFYGNSNTGTTGYFVSNSGTGVFGYAPNGTGVIGMTNSASEIGVSAINNVNGLALSVKGGLRINGGNTNPGAGKVLTSDAQGNATWQTPAPTATIGFLVSGVAQGGLQILPNDIDYKIHPAVKEYDGSNNFSLYTQSPSSTFTAPVAGLYRFTIRVRIESNDMDTYIDYSYLDLMVRSNGIDSKKEFAVEWNPDWSTASLTLDKVVALKAGDQVWASSITKTEDNSNPILTYCDFAGYLIK
ncbi:C1q-like domain-containing protein [Lacibacter sediminis]|uniref:C1q domain-containing protein n=1 Tax=Lacibacter sediminis TaxID=2760713 RepID=A0A7G5XIG0_9BACT|nr:hypothetical protein [Lacibacter sediminis]QNA45263.1 hypothetical protein H4075_03410 [Lacibacter sediminis]